MNYMPQMSNHSLIDYMIMSSDPYQHFQIAHNTDGTLTRYMRLPKTKANPVASLGDPVLSKDLTLNAQNKTRVRVYIPTPKLSSNDGIKDSHHNFLPWFCMGSFKLGHYPGPFTKLKARITSFCHCC